MFNDDVFPGSVLRAGPKSPAIRTDSGLVVVKYAFVIAWQKRVFNGDTMMLSFIAQDGTSFVGTIETREARETWSIVGSREWSDPC